MQTVNKNKKFMNKKATKKPEINSGILLNCMSLVTDFLIKQAMK